MRNPHAASGLRQVIAALAVLALGAVSARAATQEITRATIPTPAGTANHGAAIAELASKALLACWFSGLHEADRSVRILCSRGASDGSSWSAPWTAVAPGDQAYGAAAPNKSLGNVTLTVSPDGRVWMIHGVIQSNVWPIIGEMCRTWVCGRIDARVSADEGRSWSHASRLVDVDGALPRGELMPVSGGWLAPIYEENAQRSAIAKVSLDGASAAIEAIWRLDGWKLIEPALVPERHELFRVYFRDQQRRGVHVATFDPAAGWSAVSLTNLPNPGSPVDGFLDDEGRDVVIYNPSSTSRDVLALARSIDGDHFTRGCDLSQPDAEDGVAYPSVIRTHDGAWSVVYSTGAKHGIAFVRFTSAWLEDCFTAKG